MFYVIVLLIIALGIEFYYFTDKLNEQRRYLFTLKRENDLLKDKAKSSFNNYKSLGIKFSNPPFNYGALAQNTELFLCPLPDSPILAKMDTPIRVSILSKAQALDEIWYEVCLDVSTNINSRGWVKSSKMIFNETTNITAKY